MDTAQPSASKCVLVVDDEMVVRTLMGDILDSVGHRVLFARNGREGVEVFKQEPGAIDLVVLDLTMPQMDGVETFHALIALDPQVRVLLSSGYSRSEIIDRFPDREPTGFVQKPFRVHTILEKVAEAMAG